MGDSEIKNKKYFKSINMKKILSAALFLLFSASVYAENIQTVVLTPTPQMSCNNCEKKIKMELRNVKGTKKIETSLKEQTVTITYDADKAKVQEYIDAMSKIGRKAEIVNPSTEKKAETSNKN